MHAMLMTFKPQVPEDEFAAKAGPRLHEMAEAPGFIMKAFVAPAPDTWGGFYLFASKSDAEAFLAGEFFTWFRNSDLLSDVQVQHFEVDDEPSRAFGTPTVPLAERTAA